MRQLVKRKLAAALAVLLVVQGTIGIWRFPVLAEEEGLIWDEDQDLWDDLETPSNAATASDVEISSDTATPSNMATPSNAGELATTSNLLRNVAIGDLWEQWNGDDEFPGLGTEARPYQIGSLALLMGLSEAVAAGEDFADQYFELTNDIDLGDLELQNGNWNPIGWYQNRAEFAGDVAHPFRGHFDGAGNTIRGLKLINPAWNLKNIGLFGVIDGGSVENLILEAEDVYGVENVGLLAGMITGSAVIRDVTVSGYAYSAEDAGGIAAEVIGNGSAVNGQVTIENCRADSIILNSEGSAGYVGGIAGNVQRAYLIDNTVLTQNGNSNRIQGKCYVGGIAGRMRETSIYNSYVNGTIGGNGSRAIGGIVGKYESGNLVLARMAGDISRSNNGSASREGTFVGTRDARDQFTYGTEKDSHLAYLYTNSAAKAKLVFGSTIDGDNSYTQAAHIGYWTDVERKYVTVAGQAETGCKDRYFYEELEDGIRYIITQKLGKEYTTDGYAKNLPFRIDHFAPGYMGEPIRGYLVDIPRIDARNANGTFDTDVAALTAISDTGSSYYRAIDKDHVAAMAPGIVVTVTTAPKNTNENRYQMVVSTAEAGGVKAPTYREEDGSDVPMNYVKGGSYTFIMPPCDTELNAEYVKVTTQVALDPADTLLQVVQTRSGDRKAPGIVTEVKNGEGILIARYIDGVLDQSVEVQPVAIHATLNGMGQTVDQSVKWSVDDAELLENRSETGYTLKDAAILPNLNSSFIQNIINREVKAQADHQYREKINDTIYTQYAVLTASTNPETSVNNQPVYANCRIAVIFRILDQTTVRVEGLNLNREKLACTITRKLTGNRKNPTQTMTCSEPVVLTASLYPEQPFLKHISWSDRESGKIIALAPAGNYTQDCRVTVQCDLEGKQNPAWIQNVILADNARKALDPNLNVSGSTTYTERVTAVSEDQTHGHIAAVCDVTITFETVDATVAASGGSNGSSGGGGGSSSGGSGGGGSSGGGSSSGAGTAAAAGPGMASGAQLPAYVVTGTWSQNDAGKWMFTDGDRTYANEWAAVRNPYANPEAGQSAFDWFLFDAQGCMVTGWHTDANGDIYYLHETSDGTLGRMVTGWNTIGGKDCYFHEVSDGRRGALEDKKE
ncbi:MAG: hypothetical protein PHV18_10270 [Lachnospiraceae bacterium]|nr:hypothetical protein [Lachnospiraceae bacterium]